MQIPILILVSLIVSAVPALSATLGPETTLDYNNLQKAASGLRLNTAPKTVRLDASSQISPLHTCLMPSALTFDALEIPLESEAGELAPKTHLLEGSKVGSTGTVGELMETTHLEIELVSRIGLALPNLTIIREMARGASSSLDGNSPALTPSAGFLAMAISQRS